MGTGASGDRDSHIPSVSFDDATFVWRRYPEPAPSTEVAHAKGSDTVSISFLGGDVDVPRTQARWLAEVLLQITDFYRVKYGDGSDLDDYNRSDVAVADRR